MALFDSEFLKRLEYLSLISRRVFRGQLLAQRRTRQMGGGVEFADHRDYAPGDDFRYVNWNVYARHGDLVLKRFHEEEDLHVYLFLDCSRSMRFGDPAKFDFARQVTAALAYIALADMDRVSIVAIADDILTTYPLARGKQHILSILSFLEELEPQGVDTDLRRAAGSFVHRRNRAGLAVIVSDLFDPHGYHSGIDLLRHHRHEPNLIQVYDAAEAAPEMLGDVELADMETDALRKVTISEAALRRYRALFDDFLSSVRDYGFRYGVSCAQSTADVPFDAFILHMMRVAGAVA